MHMVVFLMGSGWLCLVGLGFLGGVGFIVFPGVLCSSWVGII